MAATQSVGQSPSDLSQQAFKAYTLPVMAYLMFVQLAVSQIDAHDLQRSLQVVCLMVSAGLLALSYHRQPAGRAPWSTRALVVSATVLIASLFSALRAEYPLAALQEIGLCIGLVTIGAGVSQSAGSDSSERVMALASLASAAYFAVALSIYGAALALGDPLDARPLNLGYSNPRFLNHAQSLTLPLVAGWSLLAQTRRRRMFAASIAALHVAWLILDLSRATAVAVAVGTAAIWMLGARRYATRLALVGVLGVVVWGLLFQLLPILQGAHWSKSFASASQLTSAHSRGRLLELAWRMATEHPLLGVGPMHFAATVNPTAAHPHNFYLQWAAEFGWPSTLLVIGVLCTPVTRAALALRHAPSLRDGQLPVLLVAAIAGLVDGCFSGNFVMPMAQMWLAVVFGLLWGSTSPEQPRIPMNLGNAAGWSQRLRRLGQLVMMGALVASQLLLAYQTWQQWKYDPPRIQEGSPQPGAGELSRPRFWLNGWI